jgi:glyoxylase-like metal-dependent hydrolase (beta-lactamase superfamily II)
VVVQRLAADVRLVVAPNSGPMTLEGTNTWIVGDVELGAPVVVDPGPADEAHLQAVLEACGGRVAEIVLTHGHDDHSAGAPRLAELAGCGVRAADPGLRVGAVGLAEGDQLEVAGARLTAYATPGHTSDSCSLLLIGTDGVPRLLSGDTVLGRGTTVIAHPDGDLASYLESLIRLQELVRACGVSEILPGHGPRVGSPTSWLAYYRDHRQERLQQVRDALSAGDRTAADVVARVYDDVDPALRPAAERSVLAQLAYLEST